MNKDLHCCAVSSGLVTANENDIESAYEQQQRWVNINCDAATMMIKKLSFLTVKLSSGAKISCNILTMEKSPISLIRSLIHCYQLVLIKVDRQLLILC
jgi:hypothetical protein